MRELFADRQFRAARLWSNLELRTIAPRFSGHVVNVSAWDDRDKEGGHYKDYFVHASDYSYTNHVGYRGFQGMANEYSLDLTGDVPEELRRRFDVVFNHTTLEHIFDVQKAFANLCALSKDVVIVIVPFVQVQHESDDWKDYWRFTPSCLRRLYEANGLTVVYESHSPSKDAAVYLLSVGARNPERWGAHFPEPTLQKEVGAWIGQSKFSRLLRVIRMPGKR
jgi:hypothetical protein